MVLGEIYLTQVVCETGATKMSQVKVGVRFNKLGRMKFISHLDLMRVFSRAIRRAGLPVVITKGFTPRFKIKFENALKLGLEARDQKMVIFLDKPIPLKKIYRLLKKEFPEGINIIGASYGK